MFHKGGPGKQRGFGFGGFSLAAKKEDPLPANIGSGMPVSTSGGSAKKNHSSHGQGFHGTSSFPLPGARKP